MFQLSITLKGLIPIVLPRIHMHPLMASYLFSPYYYLIDFFFEYFFPPSWHSTAVLTNVGKRRERQTSFTLKYHGNEVPSSSIHYLQIRCFSFLANTGSGSGYLYLSLKWSKSGKRIRCQNTWSVSFWSGSKSRLNFEYNVLVHFSGPLKGEKLKFMSKWCCCYEWDRKADILFSSPHLVNPPCLQISVLSSEPEFLLFNRAAWLTSSSCTVVLALSHHSFSVQPHKQIHFLITSYKTTSVFHFYPLSNVEPVLYHVP